MEDRWKADATLNLLRSAWVEGHRLRREQYEMIAEGCEWLREWALMMAEEVGDE